MSLLKARPSQKAKPKRLLSDTKDHFSVAEEIFQETSGEPELDTNRRWQIAKHAESYLSGGVLNIVSASLRGPFDGINGETVAASVYQTDRENSIADSFFGEPPSATQDALASRAQILQDVTVPILGKAPITRVRGKDVFPHTVINSSGEKCVLKRLVTSWPHELRAENHAERWEKTGRPYVQNTPWKRRKIIPPFVPKKLSKDLGGSAQVPHGEVVDANNAPQDRPITPARQFINVDSQQPVLGLGDTQWDQNSCQTVELLNDSYAHPGDVHARLQGVLQSVNSRVLPSSLTLGGKENTAHDLSTPIKLKQLEEAIDRELLELPSTLELPDELPQDFIGQDRTSSISRHHHTDSVILVSSSFDEESGQPSTKPPPSRDPLHPSSGSSTDRIESSQPEERVTSQVGAGSESKTQHGRSPRTGISEQTTIKTSFQINKSFDEKSKTAVSEPQKSPAHLYARVMPSIEGRFPLRDSTSGTSHGQSSAASQPKKGILRYGKKKSTAKHFSCSSSTTFLNDSSYSQHQSPEQALIQKYGYNYDVGCENHFDSDVNEIGSFLTSWDREKNNI